MSLQFSIQPCLSMYHAAIPEATCKASGSPLRAVRAARAPKRGVRTNHSFVFQIEIPIVNSDTCQEAYTPLKKKVTKDMICAGEKEGKRRTQQLYTHCEPGVDTDSGDGNGRAEGEGREEVGEYRTFAIPS